MEKLLKLIIAPPGAGKTAFITKQIKDKRGQTPVLLVPEQSHFETERLIYKTLGARTACDINITSFTKLAASIITENNLDKTYASDAVREITMLISVHEIREGFRFYRKVCEKADFAARMLGVITAFQREGISPSDLAKSINKIKNPRLKNKIHDLALIYKNYNSAISEDFSDRQNEIRIAATLAYQTEFFNNKSVYIDGFDGFTGGQLLMLQAIIKSASETVITLTADRINPTNPNYIITAHLTKKLTEIASRKNVKVENIFLAELPGRNPCKTEIYQLCDLYEESYFTAAKIRELITAGGFTANDIAVLNPPSQEILISAFKAYGLSFFCDLPESIIEKPVIKFIITVLEALEGRQGAVSELISSGFLRIDGTLSRPVSFKNFTQIKITDKKTYNYNKRGKKTYKLSREHIKNLIRAAREWQFDEKDWNTPLPYRCVQTEVIRAEIMGKLNDLNERIKNATGDKITEELSHFLINEIELGRTISNIVYHGQKVNSELNDEYRSLWETVMSILENVHAALRNRSINLETYKSVLKSIFIKTLIAKPPQVLDAVIVGDLKRSRISGVKVVFLMGASKDTLPPSSSTGEFSQTEVEGLDEAGIFIEENREDKYYREKFIINRALTLGTEKLFVTAALRDGAWKEAQPARIISELREFKKSPDDLPLSFWASHEKAYSFLSAEKGFTETDYNKNYLHEINPKTAQILMLRDYITPGRIETLNTCLFKYFCSEGLRIGSRRILNPDIPDALTRGNLVHYVLEKTLKEYNGENYGRFIEVEPQSFTSIAEMFINEFEALNYSAGVSRSARKKNILLRHANGIAEVLKQIQSDMKASGFRPFMLEKSFEFMLGKQKIKGKIDRLDILENSLHDYVRVIDYKTGSKQFSFPKIELGLNLQALIYLFAAAEINENYKPSGAYYRLINGGKLSEDVLEYGVNIAAKNSQGLYRNRMETQRSSGLQFGDITREDFTDISAINSEFKQELPNIRKKFINAETLEEAKFDELREKVANQLKQRLDELMSGDVKAQISCEKNALCEYCDYKNICGNPVKIRATSGSVNTL